MQTRFSARSYSAGLCLAFLLAACSDHQTDETQADPADFARLFEEGFSTAMAGASGDQGEQTPSAANLRLGIPYESASRITRQVEAGLAANLAENFTLDFALADPRAYLTEGKARALYQSELRARGLPADSVAGATALLFGVAWEIANGRKLSAQENAAILRQINTRLRGDALERQGDAERQVQAEVRLLTAALWLEEAYLREPFPDQTRDLSDAVHRDFQTMSGNDLRAQRVTENGFEER